MGYAVIVALNTPSPPFVRASFHGEPFACSFAMSLQTALRGPLTVGQIACVGVVAMRAVSVCRLVAVPSRVGVCCDLRRDGGGTLSSG